MIRFGESWGARICSLDTVEHVTIPAGIRCFECQHELDVTAQGVGIPYVGDLEYLEGGSVLIHNRVHHLLYHIDCFRANLGLVEG